MKKLSKLFNLVLPLITISVLVLTWAIVAAVKGNEYVVPTVNKTIGEFFNLFLEPKFFLYSLLTVMRSVLSFALSFFIATVLSYAASKSKAFERLTLPFISMVRALPTIAIAWLILFWTNSQVAPIVITMLVIMPTTYTQMKNAFDCVDKGSVDAAMVDGAGWKHLFYKIELPQITPELCNVVGGGVALSFKLMVAAEVLSATIKSIGAMLNDFSYSFEVSKLLALALVVLILGLIVEFVFNSLGKKLGEWK